MADLLKKIQTLISANLHAMVDSALKANSMAVFDQYVREVEDNLENLEDAVATVGGELKTLRRKKTSLDEKASELDRNIDIFLREGKEDLALAAQSSGSQILPALAATLGCSLAFCFPVATPPNAIVYGSGHVSLTQMIRVGVLLDLGCALLWRVAGVIASRLKATRLQLLDIFEPGTGR